MEAEYAAWLSGAYGLTRREMQALELLAEGKTREEIADGLNMSVHTVDKHLTGIYEKLGVKNGPQAVAKWLRHKMPPGMPNIFC